MATVKGFILIFYIVYLHFKVQHCDYVSCSYGEGKNKDFYVEFASWVFILT